MTNKVFKEKFATYLAEVKIAKGSFIVSKEGKRTFYQLPLQYCRWIADGFMDYIAKVTSKKVEEGWERDDMREFDQYYSMKGYFKRLWNRIVNFIQGLVK